MSNEIENFHDEEEKLIQVNELTKDNKSHSIVRDHIWTCPVTSNEQYQAIRDNRIEQRKQREKRHGVILSLRTDFTILNTNYLNRTLKKRKKHIKI